MAHFIAPISWGLGDLIVSLPAVQALIDLGKQTHLVTRSSLQEGLSERIGELAGVISERDFGAYALADNDSYVNLRDYPLQRDVWWGSPSFEEKY